jgi:hypothetical protein
LVVDLEGNSKPIEEIQEGDWVLARNEFDPHEPLELKRVEEKFVRTAAVMELVINGQAIKTTAEHPFYVPAQERFVPAGELQVGDLLVSSQGTLIPIESISSLNEITTVYNLRVADHHTYFVGGALWGWDVWVHNASYSRNSPGNRGVKLVLEGGDQRIKLRTSPAEAFEDSLVGAASDVASGRRIVPALQFTPPKSSQNPYVRLDGLEPDTSNVLIDRKLSIVRFPTRSGPMIPDATRIREVSEALRQNPGHRIIYEFPTSESARNARRILREIGVSNIEIRVAN